MLTIISSLHYVAPLRCATPGRYMGIWNGGHYQNGFMQIVPNRQRVTLLPIIQAHTLPGTIIHSDDYAIYRTAVG